MSAQTPLRRSPVPWPAVAVATVLAALAALAVIVVFGGDEDARSQGPEPGRLELTPIDDVEAGDPLAVPVEWPDGGDDGPLAGALDGPTVVNFFASWCTPCIAEMPEFEEVFQEVGAEVDFVGVAVSDRTADARRIVEQTGITYRWARDGRGDVANAAAITQMPATMFVDADGEVVTVHSGALDADELRDLIEAHLGPAGAAGG
jgi:thiol-disulfide isomerase/thioredoxin